MTREFYLQDTKAIAQKLLGKILIHNTPEGITKGMIVETEAYYGELDPASHAFGGKKTKRNEVMWGPAGYAYIYFTYGMYYMFNVVTGKEGEARAVLIRAVAPIEGIELMKKRRKIDNARNLTSGPAKLTQAFGITKEQNRTDILNSNLKIVAGQDIPLQDITSRPRIGVKDKTELRFYIKGNPFVSVI